MESNVLTGYGYGAGVQPEYAGKKRGVGGRVGGKSSYCHIYSQ